MVGLCTPVYVVGLGLLLLFTPTVPQTIDIPTLQALALWAAVLIVVTSLLTDLALAWLDPRIRASGRPPG